MSQTQEPTIRDVAITIYAKVATSITLEEGETPEGLRDRCVDIYLHGAGEHGYINKNDLGADAITIAVDKAQEMAFVNKGLLRALIATVKNTTDLDHIYDDEGNSYSWSELNRLIEN